MMERPHAPKGNLLSSLTQAGSIGSPLRGHRVLAEPVRPLQLWLEFPIEPIHRHPCPLRDSNSRLFDRMIVGKEIEQVELIQTVFRTVLYQKITGNRRDPKSLLRKEGGGARQMAG